MTTTSIPRCGHFERRKTSRINRLALFLLTASPSFREATIPSRLVPASFGATRIVRYRPLVRSDRSKTLWNSPRRLTRRSFEKRSDGMAALRRRRRPLPLRGGNREALAPLCPAPFQHLSSFFRRHAHEKTVRTLAAPSVRLERHTHRRNPLQRENKGGETSIVPTGSRTVNSVGGDGVHDRAGVVAARAVCYSLRSPDSRVGAPPEVFHNCGKKCGKARA